MSTQIDRTIFQFGRVEAQFFQPDCRPGDWNFWNVSFPAAFPSDGVRVIVTANDFGVDRGIGDCAAVGIARDVTASGFTLAARNSDCASGSAGFNWLAVLETNSRQDPPDLRMGMAQPPLFFDPDCVRGDWQNWIVYFSAPPFADIPIVLLTAGNLNVRGSNPAIVGLVRQFQLTQTTVRPFARNSDCSYGDAMLYYVALSGQAAGRSDLWVDTGDTSVWGGTVSAYDYARDCAESDWRVRYIHFTQSFLTPPIVLVTANNRGVLAGQHNPAVVGVVRDVTTHGFMLHSRNSDCSPGRASFYWVAIGCARGCG